MVANVKQTRGLQHQIWVSLNNKILEIINGVDAGRVYEPARDRFGNPHGAATKVEVLVKRWISIPKLMTHELKHLH